MSRTVSLLIALLAGSFTLTIAADCTGENQLADVSGTLSCDRGGSSPDVCVQDAAGIVSCGMGDGVSAGRITEARVMATQYDYVDDDVSDAIQVWGYDLPDAKGYDLLDDSPDRLVDGENSDWCCFFSNASELHVVMNDKNNIVMYGCASYGNRSSRPHGYLKTHIPTETSLLRGDDFLLGGSGGDTAWGGTGDDYIWDCGGDDHFLGELGADLIWGGKGDDEIYGGDGRDLLFGETGNDLIHGGKGNDEIDGGSGDDDIYGDPGDDEIRGAGGNDWIYGGDGADDISGGDGRDLLCGGDDNDVLRGKSGPDRIFGEDGRDIAKGGQGEDTCEAEHESSCPLDPSVGDICVQPRPEEDVIVMKPTSTSVDDRAMEKRRKKARRAWAKRRR